MDALKSRIVAFVALAGILLYIATSCSTDESDTQSADDSNTAPLVSAGIDLNVITGLPVKLDGSGSHDPDGDALNYLWTMESKPPGSMAALSDATAVDPYFTPDLDGIYVISLVVNDGTEDSHAEKVTFTAGATAENPPIADAGSDRKVVTGTLVTLDGSNSWDPDGDVISYVWSLHSKPSGSKAALSDATSVNPTFTPDVDGNYIISLVVNDGNIDSGFDNVTITAGSTAENPPVADAGPNQNVVTGLIVTLDGRNSSDPDGDALTYSWKLASKPAGSATALANATSVNPSFTPDTEGVYVINLMVNDGQFDSDIDSVRITATSASSCTGNTPPVADAGDDQDVVLDLPVRLDGRDSYDVDLGSSSEWLLDYTWTFVSKPAGSSAKLTTPLNMYTYFTPDVEGDYTFRLVANDGCVDSAPDTVVVSATEYSLVSDYDFVGHECDYSTNSAGETIADITLWIVNRGASDPGATLRIREDDVFLGTHDHVAKIIYETPDGDNSTPFRYELPKFFQASSWTAFISDDDNDALDFDVEYLACY